MSSPNVDSSGLQAHSCGPLYPWSVKVVQTCQGRIGYCVGFNLATGQHLHKRWYDATKDYPNTSFRGAHRLAESDCQRQLDSLALQETLALKLVACQCSLLAACGVEPLVIDRPSSYILSDEGVAG